MKKIFTLFVMATLCTVSALAATGDVWTVVGNHAIMNGTTDWAQTNADNDMTSTDGENWTLTVTGKTLEANVSYEFKICKDHAWDESYGLNSGNASLSVSETAVYTVVFEFNSTTKTIATTTTKTGDSGEVTHTYSVAGSDATVLGASWDASNTKTDMTYNVASGLYVWVSDTVDLTAETIEYKVVVDHAWGTSYGADGGNAKLVIDNDGKYVITFTFDASSKAVNAVATPIEVQPTTHVYSVVGSDANLFGAAWDQKATATEMTTADEGATYTWTNAQVALTAGDIEYKVVRDHSWDVCYPATYNATLNIAEDGTYEVVFTLEVASGNVSAVATKKSTTGINDINVINNNVRKVIENGQVVIYNGNVKYNVMGACIK